MPFDPRFKLAALAAALSVLCATTTQADLSQPGPYAAGSTQVLITRPDSSVFSALLYYPATSAGTNTPLAPGLPIDVTS